jgi:hypothetical protein
VLKAFAPRRRRRALPAFGRASPRQRTQIGEQTITVTVPRQPTRAGIDPYHLLIDLTTDDNMKRVGVKK